MYSLISGSKILHIHGQKDENNRHYSVLEWEGAQLKELLLGYLGTMLPTWAQYSYVTNLHMKAQHGGSHL